MTTAAIAAGSARCHPADGVTRLIMASESTGRIRQLADLAGRAHISLRTLIRRFQGEYGVTPSQWLRRERLRRAQELLETTSMPVDQVAHTSGYGTAASMRQSFARDLHTSPAAYRQGFRHRAGDAAG